MTFSEGRQNDESQWVGNRVLIWKVVNDEDNKVLYAAIRSSETWSSPVLISPAENDVDEFQAKGSADGSMAVVWSVLKDEKTRLYTAFWSKEWSPTEPLSDPEKDCASFQLMSDPEGRLIAVWDEQLGKKSSIHGAVLGQEISRFTLSPPGQNCWAPSLVFGDDGKGMVSWSTTWDCHLTHVQVSDLIIDERRDP